MITTRTWAIAGAAAALILVPAGVSYAVTTTADSTPTAIENVQARQVQQSGYTAPAGEMNGAGYGDHVQGQARSQSGDQQHSQVRDPAQDQSGDYTRDQARDQLRDTEDCDGDGPVGDGPQSGSDSGRGGMMGGRGSGR